MTGVTYRAIDVHIYRTYVSNDGSNISSKIMFFNNFIFFFGDSIDFVTVSSCNVRNGFSSHLRQYYHDLIIEIIKSFDISVIVLLAYISTKVIFKITFL